MRILVVDDDGHIREVIRFALSQAGFEVHEAADGHQALHEIARVDPDLIVLDICMPGPDGLEVCRRVRKDSSTPILFLSSRDDEIDKILGLELGGDDYLAKPFSPRELVARVKAILRRGNSTAANRVLEVGELRLDPDRHVATWMGAVLELTATEMRLLLTLAQRPGMVLSRAQLVDRVWGDDHYITDRTVDSHVRRIRAKLREHGGDPIDTVYGVGYRLLDKPALR